MPLKPTYIDPDNPSQLREPRANDTFINEPDVSFDNISDLTDYKIDQSPRTKTANVMGYYSAGDGGGGTFYWDSTEDKANHNGGTVINPDHNSTIGSANWYSATGDSTDTSGSGCWVRPDEGFVNVKWFGAKTDGSDASVAIQKCVDYAKGTIIIIPSGDYIISNTIDLNWNTDDNSWSGTKIIGAGQRKTNLLANCSDAVLKNEVSVSQASNYAYGYKLTIKDLSITGNNDTNCDAINLINTFFAQIEGVRINSMSGGGILFPDRSDLEADVGFGGGDDSYANANINIKSCDIQSNKFGIKSEPWSTTLYIQKCLVNNNDESGLIIKSPNGRIVRSSFSFNGRNGSDGGLLIDFGTTGSSATPTGLVIEDCEFDTNSNYQLQIASGYNIDVSQNRFIDRENNGSFYSTDLVKLGSVGNSVFNNRIENNYIRVTQHSTDPSINLFTLTSQTQFNVLKDNYILSGASSNAVEFNDSGDSNEYIYNGKLDKRTDLFTRTPSLLVDDLSNTELDNASTDILIWGNERFSFNSSYNTSTGKYTIPITGLYKFNGFFTINNATGGNVLSIYLYIDGSPIRRVLKNIEGLSSETYNFSFVRDLSEDDVVDIRVFHSSGSNISIDQDLQRSEFSIEYIN